MLSLDSLQNFDRHSRDNPFPKPYHHLIPQEQTRVSFCYYLLFCLSIYLFIHLFLLYVYECLLACMPLCVQEVRSEAKAGHRSTGTRVYAGPGNSTPVLCKSSLHSQLLSNSFSPSTYNFKPSPTLFLLESDNEIPDVWCHSYPDTFIHKFSFLFTPLTFQAFLSCIFWCLNVVMLGCLGSEVVLGNSQPLFY